MHVDAHGAILLYRCGRWGIAARTVERAKETYATEHLAEYGFSYSRDDEENIGAVLSVG